MDIQMPQMGESITEATIVKWHKRVGDTVREDETLLEISTAKVEAEIPAPDDGVLAEIVHSEGETVDVDTVIARLAPVGTKLGEIEKAVEQKKRDEEPHAMSKEAQARSGQKAKALAQETVGGAAAPPPPAAPREMSTEHSAVEMEREKLLRRKSTPLVRNIAKELGLDIEQIKGTGTRGRVTKADVMAFLEQQRMVEQAKDDFRPHTPGRAKAPTPKSPNGATAEMRAPEGARPIGFEEGELKRVEPMSTMRKMIAQHMVESRRISPHAYTVFEIDMTATTRLRNESRKEFEARYGVKLTPLAFIMRAAADALVHFPILNSSIENDNIVYHRHVNMGVAVALEDGLIVPVVRNLEEKSMVGIARGLADIAHRARMKKLNAADVEGGTFTITSPGQKGALFGTPIIAQPQVAIMHVGAIHKRPSVIEGPDGSDMIAIRDRVILTLGIDHRAIDGWVADSFMSTIKERIEKADFHVLD
ncbi:2-oxo acid dehydrogenase subunit E2 [bacterium]|nr:2-oxo acid dehydrogenase subunit E2 [bacterium]